MPARKTDVLVIGGGAAGLMAAIAAARTGASVVIVEKNDRVGKKILATGNGRCNLSNVAIAGELIAASYNHPAFVAPTLENCDYNAVRTEFFNLGLLTKPDERGWVFPQTRIANSVLDVLLNAIRRRDIDVRTSWEVQRIQVEKSGFLAEAAGPLETNKTREKRVSATALVLACGAQEAVRLSATLPFAAATALVPILGPLKTEPAPLKGLNGVRVQASARLLEKEAPVVEERGEILFRDYGVSGIAAFNLSRFVTSGQELSLDFFSEFSGEELDALLAERLRIHPRIQAEEFLDGLVHPRLTQAVLRHIKVRGSDELNESLLKRLAHTMKDYRLIVTGGPSPAQAQVTRGGLATSGFDPTTLQSLTIPRLFAAGECLDIDGPCGGFNLHWAWASGLVAGGQAGRQAGQQARH
jgi:predicted Rossmann fold flavoprotein